MKAGRFLIIVLFAASALLRVADTFRPINIASWRECDLGSIARNFVREGMDPAYPRIDWRGDGPGYAEMEVPILPFLTAVSYSVLGVHDQFARIWAFLFSLGAMFFFFKLAREYLDEFAATVAFAFFVLNPLLVDISTAVQPEGLMLFAYTAAAYFFVRWLRHESARDFWPAAAMTALSLLAKAPAGHIGLFFGILLLEKYGFGVIKQTRVWLFGAVTLLPAVLWYVHAKNLWITYGNSLGVSNEYHWVGIDFLTDATYMTGILRTEVFSVWAIFGLVVAAFGISRGYRETTARHLLLWMASIFVFYIVAARTASQDWAAYYHGFSVIPASLLIGFGIKQLSNFGRNLADDLNIRSSAENLARGSVMAAVLIALTAALAFEAKQVRKGFLDHRVEDNAYAWAHRIRPAMGKDGMILASGGHCVSKSGHQLAHNASYFFYWLDRKGWNICVEDQSVAKVRVFADKGATYFVAEKASLDQRPGFENDLRSTYSLVDSNQDFMLFDLTELR